jgi:hypothetical protein
MESPLGICVTAALTRRGVDDPVVLGSRRARICGGSLLSASSPGRAVRIDFGPSCVQTGTITTSGKPAITFRE